MQKYIIGADPEQCPIILPFDESGAVGEWQRFGAGIMYKAEEVDAAIAAKDRDLADANHALLLANNSADAFRRVAERGIELTHNEVSCLEQIKEFLDAQYMIGHQGYYSGCGWVGATLAEIIKKAQQVSQIPVDLTEIIIRPTAGGDGK